VNCQCSCWGRSLWYSHVSSEGLLQDKIVSAPCIDGSYKYTNWYSTRHSLKYACSGVQRNRYSTTPEGYNYNVLNYNVLNYNVLNYNVLNYNVLELLLHAH
jgi:hypothetical protein